MAKRIVVRDKVVAVYPLLVKSTGIKSGLYTSTVFDIYKYKGVKYVRGKAQLYAELLDKAPKGSLPLSSIPNLIENGYNFDKWKCKYDHNSYSDDGSLLESYVAFKVIKGA